MANLALTSGLLVLSLSACVTTSTRALIGNPGLPVMPAVDFKIVSPVEGNGSSWTLSPAITELFSPSSVVQRAEEDAVGAAIYARNDIDMIIAPKTKISHLNLLGLFSRASVTVKGQGVKLEGPVAPDRR